MALAGEADYSCIVEKCIHCVKAENKKQYHDFEEKGINLQSMKETCKSMKA